MITFVLRRCNLKFDLVTSDGETWGTWNSELEGQNRDS